MEDDNMDPSDAIHNPSTAIQVDSHDVCGDGEVLPKLNLPDHMYNIYTIKRSLRNWRYKRRCCSLIPAESDSLPHAHTQATKTYYKHQDSRINKAQELNTKTSASSDIQDLPKNYQDYQDNDCQGRLLASFQDDA
ncbi:hypothetical protein Tco_1244052 [Tanacetum coccineum]